jgi:hypothetical protein
VAGFQKQPFPGDLATTLQQLEEALREAAAAAFFGGCPLRLGQELLHFLVDLIGFRLKQFGRGRLHHQSNQISHTSALYRLMLRFLRHPVLSPTKIKIPQRPLTGCRLGITKAANHRQARDGRGLSRSGSKSSPARDGIPYLFRVSPVIRDIATSVARRAAFFVISALINNAFPVAFRASFVSHVCALPDKERKTRSLHGHSRIVPFERRRDDGSSLQNTLIS